MTQEEARKWRNNSVPRRSWRLFSKETFWRSSIWVTGHGFRLNPNIESKHQIFLSGISQSRRSHFCTGYIHCLLNWSESEMVPSLGGALRSLVLIKCRMPEGRICPAVSGWEIGISRLLWVRDSHILEHANTTKGGLWGPWEELCSAAHEMDHNPALSESCNLSWAWFIAKHHLNRDAYRL